MLEISTRALVNMICSTVTGICSYPGNILILKFFSKGPWKELNSYHLCILHLAIADLVASIFGQIWNVYQYLNYNWITTMPDKIKMVFNFTFLIYLVSALASGFILLVMSYDRYLKLSNPMNLGDKAKRKINILNSLAYLVSLISTIPSDLFIKTRQIEIVLNMVTYTLGTLVLVILPIIGNVWFYIKIKSNFNKNLKETTRYSTNHKEIRKHRMRNKSAVKTLKWLTIIMLISVAGPRIFLAVMFGMVVMEKRSVRNGLTLNNDGLKLAFLFVNNLLLINNAVNAFVYYRFNKDFKAYVRACFGCRAPPSKKISLDSLKSRKTLQEMTSSSSKKSSSAEQVINRIEKIEEIDSKAW